MMLDSSELPFRWRGTSLPHAKETPTDATGRHDQPFDAKRRITGAEVESGESSMRGSPSA
jgi:hypothetical protein